MTRSGSSKSTADGGALDRRIARKVRDSFARQGFMATLGARIVAIRRGMVRIAYRSDPGLSQQHGHMHAGVATAIADSACGYAALSAGPQDAEVLTIEFKANFLRPASGKQFEAVGRVRRAGRNLAFCEGEVWETKPQRQLIVTMNATMFLWQPQVGG